MALLNYAAAYTTRYVHKPVPRRQRDNYFFTSKFYTYSSDEFRQHFRTTRHSFGVIASLIEDNEVFRNNSNFRQTHPSWQLAVALQRLGHYGSRAAVQIIASDMGISVGSVVEFTNRVIEALNSIANEWLLWPEKEEREDHGRAMRKEGFPGCVGFIDGTTLPLFNKPGYEGPSYFDRKKSQCSNRLQHAWQDYCSTYRLSRFCRGFYRF
ncbi:hypothetical protein F5H01DRAFT_167742 [Linnemannia elongata]|nr:hypothetical protein F5H01DRAFT_167742 [Linnemannia elongata]